MGLRELIWILIGLLAVYVVVQLLRIARRPAGSPPAPVPEQAPAGEVTAEPPAPGAGGASEPPGDMLRARADQVAVELEFGRVRRELAQMRSELESQQAELERQVEALAALKESVGALQAAQHVSPHYTEAVALARRGLESEAIAERCGISVAEAALVRSLAQRAVSEEDSGGA